MFPAVDRKIAVCCACTMLDAAMQLCARRMFTLGNFVNLGQLGKNKAKIQSGCGKCGQFTKMAF
jgi:hypothetical protein